MELRDKRKKTLHEIASADVAQFKAQEAECALLGAMLVNSDVIPEVTEIIKSSDVFRIPRHIPIYEGLIALGVRTGHKVDIVQLVEWIKASGQADDDLVDYLIMLSESFPSSAAAPYYARIVQDAHNALEIYGDTLDACKAILSAPKDAQEVVARLEARLLERRAVTEVDVPELAGDIAGREIEMAQSGGKGRGIPTGYPGFDEATGGCYPAEMTVVGARPSMGKTGWLLDVLINGARAGHAGLLFSVEMSKPMIVQRILSYMTGISQVDIRKGNLDRQRIIDLQEAAAELRSIPLYIDGQANTPGLIRARTRQEMAKRQIKTVGVDYLQLVQPDQKKDGYGNRDNEVGTMSRAFKALAKDLGLSLLLLSQLNRGPESRDGHRPRMSDLRESGSIEQDADVIVMLHREDYYYRDNANYSPKHTGEIIIAKQRNGPCETITVDTCPFTGRWLPTQERIPANAFGGRQ